MLLLPTPQPVDRPCATAPPGWPAGPTRPPGLGSTAYIGHRTAPSRRGPRGARRRCGPDPTHRTAVGGPGAARQRRNPRGL